MQFHVIPCNFMRDKCATLSRRYCISMVLWAFGRFRIQPGVTFFKTFCQFLAWTMHGSSIVHSIPCEKRAWPFTWTMHGIYMDQAWSMLRSTWRADAGTALHCLLIQYKYVRLHCSYVFMYSSQIL